MLPYGIIVSSLVPYGTFVVHPGNAQSEDMMARQAHFEERFGDDIVRWKTEDIGTARRVVRLVEQVTRRPTEGCGRPKKLGGLPGIWSRRITREHRLFYQIEDNGTLRFLQCHGHDLDETTAQAARERR